MQLDPKPDLIGCLPRLRRYAWALTGDAERADDLVQDTLERALAKLDLWQPGSDLRAWLFTLMHHLFVNQLRVQRPQDTVLDEVPEIPVSGCRWRRWRRAASTRRCCGCPRASTK